MSVVRRPKALLCAAALAGAALLPLAAPSQAGPVMCADGDVSPDGRIFPEPLVSNTYLAYDEFECAVRHLEETFPDRVEVTTIGKSFDGHEIYDILITDETVKTPKQKLLIVNSIHGNEPGGREGGVRVMEDWVDPRFDGEADWVIEGLKKFVVHFVFPNPDGWVAGDVTTDESSGAGTSAQRGNGNGRDLNRQFPVTGYIYEQNATLEEPETKAIMAKLFHEKGWYLGTDNHGQGPDTYGAAGLQIVGQFDFQKSETLARYADAISDAFAENNVLSSLETLNDSTGQDLGAYHWGTLYDMLGYSASGSMIDYYNTADGLDGTGYATELTVGSEINKLTWPRPLAQLWVDLIRAINDTMLKQALVEQRFTFPVGGSVGYVFDPEVVRDDDANKAGPEDAGVLQKPYAVTRMKFFSDLNKYASRDLTSVRVSDIVATKGRTLDRFDSLVLADDPMPESADADLYYAALKAWVQRGGNLVVTDAAASAMQEIGLLPFDEDVIRMDGQYVGSVEMATRDHPLAEGLRGVARQTYDSVPIGFAFPPAGLNCPNWSVLTTAWEAAGGEVVGHLATGASTPPDTTRTTYGQAKYGEGMVRFIGALLPQPTEAFLHPYGLQNYAVTYTGYTLLQNSLDYDSPTLGGAAPAPAPTEPKPAPQPNPAPRPTPLPATGLPTTVGLIALASLGSAWTVRRCARRPSR
ncbi:MAG TPA: M14 family zinc carboxypeptidase [Mycobacteriales bacterium]|nr:M14 family zinc carboxypeptidase [Mycobacteriales bacterium]